MKTTNTSKRNEQIFLIKKLFFAFNVIIICIAIPLLAYFQMHYKAPEPLTTGVSAIQTSLKQENVSAIKETSIKNIELGLVTK